MGGLVKPQKEAVTKSYASLEESLVNTPVPFMPESSAFQAGAGIDLHLALSATLDFQEETGAWPAARPSPQTQHS